MIQYLALLAKWGPLLELVIDAVEHRGVSADDVTQFIKGAIRSGSDAEMAKEYPKESGDESP